MPGLSFVTLIAYDYRLAFQSIPSYYEFADEIILGLDADRVSWTKKPFNIDMDDLHASIRKIDSAGKIRIVEENFHRYDHPLLNDNFERSRLSNLCKPGNWVVQIDADEVLVNAAEFVDWLAAKNPAGNAVEATWRAVFKTFGEQALVVSPSRETVPVATMRRGQYSRARLTLQSAILSPLELLHFSWGRTADEIEQKMANWGHANDFDTEAFLRFWHSVTLDNYEQVKNFHPIYPPMWESLVVQAISPSVAGRFQ